MLTVRIFVVIQDPEGGWEPMPEVMSAHKTIYGAVSAIEELAGIKLTGQQSYELMTINAHGCRNKIQVGQFYYEIGEVPFVD